MHLVRVVVLFAVGIKLRERLNSFKTVIQFFCTNPTNTHLTSNILGVDIELTPSVSFEFGQENNNTINATSYGKLTVKLPLGNKQKFTNFSIASKAFKDSHKMNLSALAWIERDNKIKDNTIVFNGLTYGLVLSPDTGRVWLDRNLGASQV
jgi:hypothetical protein